MPVPVLFSVGFGRTFLPGFFVIFFVFCTHLLMSRCVGEYRKSVLPISRNQIHFCLSSEKNGFPVQGLPRRSRDPR